MVEQELLTGEPSTEWVDDLKDVMESHPLNKRSVYDEKPIRTTMLPPKESWDRFGEKSKSCYSLAPT